MFFAPKPKQVLNPDAVINMIIWIGRMWLDF